MTSPEAAGGQEGDVTSAMVRVVRGSPDEIELAALVAGIAAARSTADDDAPDVHRTSPWSDPGRRLGQRPAGPTAWRWSLHP